MRRAAQLSFDAMVRLPKDAYDYGTRTSGHAHGVVLTKPHVVDLILDLAGYTADRDLTQLSLLEPACGEGAFLVPAIERLACAAKRHGVDLAALSGAIAAYDIDPDHVLVSRNAVERVLLSNGLSPQRAIELAIRWVLEGDSLLATPARPFDVVVGNPPYIRIEQLAPALQAEYRRRFESLFDRADLYIAFIERGLHLLSDAGRLSFICADRWIANKYGAPLRRILTEKFGVECYVDLHTASPFESEVIAYPSIFSIRKGRSRRVHVVRLATASPEECSAVVPAVRRGTTKVPGVGVSVYDSWFEGEEPWIISSPEHLTTLRALEARCRPLEEAGGARVGIGIATGNDKVYIVGEGVDIEPDRLVPLVMREDIERGQIRDARRFVINAFNDDGGVVDLRQYPRLATYLKAREGDVRRRHVSQKNPSSWFRTIDRVYPALVRTPKLLIPDIAGSNEVVYDEGHFHPHHNLYFVTSEKWDMELLGGLLSSRIALFFVWCYAVKMRGGYLRFQAQYLRRIRLPAPGGMGDSLTRSIRAAFRARDFARLDELALEAYQLDDLPAFDFVDTRA